MCCSCVPRGGLLGHRWVLERVLLPLCRSPRWIGSTQVSWLSLSVGFPARVRFCRRSINRASSSISSGLLCLPPLWISSSLCINSAKFSMTSSKGWQGWLAEMIVAAKAESWSKVDSFTVLRGARSSPVPCSKSGPHYKKSRFGRVLRARSIPRRR